MSPPLAGPLQTRADEVPPLENGDRLTRAEFERRFDATPDLKKAELPLETANMNAGRSNRLGEFRQSLVDDVNLRSLRTIINDRHPIDVAVGPDGKLVAWADGDGLAYTVNEMTGDRKITVWAVPGADAP